MDDEVHVIKKDPFSLAAAFNGCGHHPELPLELELDFVGDGHSLALVGCGCNEEKVGQTGINRIELKDTGVFSLFVFADFGCSLNQEAGLFVCLRLGHA